MEISLQGWCLERHCVHATFCAEEPRLSREECLLTKVENSGVVLSPEMGLLSVGSGGRTRDG